MELLYKRTTERNKTYGRYTIFTKCFGTMSLLQTL